MWETLYGYLDAKCATITDLLPAVAEKARPDDVHKLRTSIKRIRACGQLAKHFKGFKGKRYAKVLKILQHAAGALRDIQLQQDSLQQYTRQNPQYKFFTALLEDRHIQAKAQAQDTARSFPVAFIKKLRQQPAQLPHISHKELSEHLQAQYAAIAIPASHADAEKWHDLRKDIKRLHYQLEAVQPLFDGAIALPAMLAFTDEAGNRLGNWHDLLALQHLIRSHMELMQSHQIPVPRDIEEVLQHLAANTGQQLQQSGEYIKAKPVVEWPV
jgi:CHAD domain-containing protein